MIFLSYNHKDGDIIDTIARKISVAFGQEKIFYDKWSIQPGDGIIDKMDEGLKNCEFFFFFVSKNSLESNMVKMEWQNALIKSTQKKIKFVPVKLDDCYMPDILLQNLYINLSGIGLEEAVRQMIDVIKGDNTYRTKNQSYENLRAYIKRIDRSVVIEIRAETYFEPISQFLILTNNQQEDFAFECESDSFFSNGFNEVTLNNGVKSNAIYVSVQRATSPGFPFILRITPKEGIQFDLNGVMKAIAHNNYKIIPIIMQQ